MATESTEWTFTADVAGWINEIIHKNPKLPFSDAKCERRTYGSLKRSDLTIINKSKSVLLTGEVKLPFQKDGSSPYNEKVVQDARKKAQGAGANFFFTWNVNECVLWETFPVHTAHKDRNYKSWDVLSPVIHKPEHLETRETRDRIQFWLAGFLNEVANIILGEVRIGTETPDEKFIIALESSLKIPISLTFEEISKKYEDSRFKSILDKWMRDEQGWIIYDDPEGIRENLERAAKFSNYALINKLVFHEALLKRYGTKLYKLSIEDHIDTAEGLRLHLEGFFAEAKKVTGDYETVFGEDHASIGNRLPFYSDSAVPHWRALIEQIHDFDFSKLDYEVIGNIFERLISPEERSKYGQFYTRPEIVDLINSFCIRNGTEKVMDPACGGGTFLVRAYARKRELAPDRKHGELLSDLFGVDVSHFATHLTTINLATRDLIDDENYPQIARSDFFNIQANRPFISLPRHAAKFKGLGEIQHRDVVIPELDAVVGNPPYIRQEDIPKSRKKTKAGAPEHGTKEFYQWLAKREGNAALSGRSDIHCYFWPHSSAFLKDDGYLCLLTSSQWLDVEYGFKLQGWILQNFEIVAVFESIDEPWFVGARVVTAVTILRRRKDESRRMENTVRFVQFRRPISEILSHDGTTGGAIAAADAFRDEILALEKNTITRRFRARLIKQGDLWQQGVELGLMMDKAKAEDEEEEDNSVSNDSPYYGGKWGVYLRAPDLWFNLQAETSMNWAPLGEIAEIKYGLKTGYDDFFYVKDLTQEYLNKFPDENTFNISTGYQNSLFKKGVLKLVGCGKSHEEIKAIESEFLEPEIHSLMEINKYSIVSKDCNRLVLLVDKTKAELKNTYVLDYIKWGESKNWHQGSTCKSRISPNRAWYDLTGHKRAPALWPKEKQYRHIAASNDDYLIANCRLYEIYPPKDYDDPNLWGGILNSSLVILASYQFGRPVGNEGNWSTMVVDVNMMLVPDVRKASAFQLQRVSEAFAKMKNRDVQPLISERRLRGMAYTQAGKLEELESLPDISELDMADRWELDDAVLELLGVKTKNERKRLREELYSYLREFFELTRQKEEKAIENKKRAMRRGKTKPADIAQQIYQEIVADENRWLMNYADNFFNPEKPFDTFDIPAEGEPFNTNNDMFSSHGVKFVKGKKQIIFIETKNDIQGELITLLANNGIRGLVRVPHDERETERVFKNYDRFLKQRDKRIRELIEARTADEDMQGKTYDALSFFLNK